jgi:hypothetical protein
MERIDQRLRAGLKRVVWHASAALSGMEEDNRSAERHGLRKPHEPDDLEAMCDALQLLARLITSG